MKRFRSRSYSLTFAAARQPVLTAVGAMVVCSLPGLALGVRTELSLTLDLINQLALCALALLALVDTGWWNEAGLNGPKRWRHLHLAVIPLAAAIGSFRGVGGLSAMGMWRYGLLALLIAFQNEVWFRGILFRVLAPAYGARRSVGLTALLFGAMQAVALLDGVAPGVTLVKALAAALCGYVLGALRLRTRTVWPGMLISFLFFLGTFLERGQESGGLLPPATDRLLMQAVLALAMFGCARFWMRRAPDQVAPEPESVRAG